MAEAVQVEDLHPESSDSALYNFCFLFFCILLFIAYY